MKYFIVYNDEVLAHVSAGCQEKKKKKKEAAAQASLIGKLIQAFPARNLEVLMDVASLMVC